MYITYLTDGKNTFPGEQTKAKIYQSRTSMLHRSINENSKKFNISFNPRKTSFLTSKKSYFSLQQSYLTDLLS